MFSSYYGELHLSDGINKMAFGEPGVVMFVCKKAGFKEVITTDGKYITGYKYSVNGRLAEEEQYGKFYRLYREHGKWLEHPIRLPYHPKTKRAVHGIVIRRDQKLFGFSGTTRTRYSKGRFLWQEFRYQNRVLAYRIRRIDSSVQIKYETGILAVQITADVALSPHASYGSYSYPSLGTQYFESFSKGIGFERQDGMLFAHTGACAFEVFDRQGRSLHKGQYQNRQKTGVWLIDRKEQVFVHGVPVSKSLWETPPEKLKISQVLRVKNAQLRAALMAKIGPERISQECRSRIIHKTRNGMQLMEFPIAVDDGNGGTKSRLRILRVKCPSTKSFYYLQVPDFVWDNGKKTKLNKCEQARQWTFGVDDPRKTIKFAKET